LTHDFYWAAMNKLTVLPDFQTKSSMA